MSQLHILRGPSVVVMHEAAGDKWCFKCRKRLPHKWQLMDDPGPSFYEPVWVCRCSECGGDHTTFPGCG